MKFPTEKEQMVIENMGLVRKIARLMSDKYSSTLFDYEDLVQVGSIGLMRAVETFDESKGFKFSTFAYRTIQGYIMREFNRSTPIRAPMHIVALARIIHKRGQQDDPLEELAKFYKCPTDYVENAFYYLELKNISADLILKNGRGAILDTFREEDDYSDSMIVQEFMDTLNPNHKDIVRNLMVGKNAGEIAKERGVYKQAVFQTINLIRKRWIEFESGERVVVKKGRPRGSGRLGNEKQTAH